MYGIKYVLSPRMKAHIRKAVYFFKQPQIPIQINNIVIVKWRKQKTGVE